ncbi:MAG: acyltransferase [Deltaproteobacteria bacterium]|nr:MAG: acyltransferase [Deltaproteobacteria bacterium]
MMRLRETRGRIPGLDGLRAVSIAIVLFAHAKGTRGFPDLSDTSVSARRPLQLALRVIDHVVGDLGVRTFFVISGFLITTLLVSEYRKHGRISLRDFYIRRVYRIFPAFYVYLAVMLIAFALGWISLPGEDIAFAATYTMNFHAERAWWLGHLWSLAVEEQFYLLWPLVLLLLRPRRALGFAVGAIAVAPVLRIIATILWPDNRLTDQAFPFVFDALATGCSLALAREELERSSLYVRVLDSQWFWFLPLACIVALSVQSTWFNLGVGVTLGNLGIALAIHRSVRHPTYAIGRLLETRPFVWIGALSYSLYLWQQPFVNRHADSILNTFPIHIAIALVIASVSYYLVEQPMLALRARRAARKQAASEATSPPPRAAA